MFGKVIGIILAVCSVQCINGSISESINKLQEVGEFTHDEIDELLGQLAKAQTEISDFVLIGEKHIRKAYASIADQVDSYIGDVAVKTFDLRTTIISAEAEASSSGKNISACSREALKPSLDATIQELKLRNFRYSRELSVLSSKVAAIGELKSDLIEDVFRCVKRSERKHDRIFVVCISENFGAETEQAYDVFIQIEPTATAALQNVKENGGNLSAEIVRSIDQIKTNFLDCANKA